MSNPVTTNIPDGNKPTENLRLLMRSAGLAMTVAQAQGYDLAGYSHIFCTDEDRVYKRVALNTDPDDLGVTTIVDAAGNRFIKTFLGPGIQNMQALSETEFAAIVTPDPNQLYFVKPNA